MYYRKESHVVHAYQMTKERRGKVDQWPQWLQDAWGKRHIEQGALYPEDFPDSDGTDRLRVVTLEGSQLVPWDYYIIKGEEGKLYLCEPTMFEQLFYERQDNESSRP